MATPTTNIGYDLNAVAGKCFLYMLGSSDWFRIASKTAGDDPQSLLTTLSTFAIMAAQTIELQITSTITKY